VETNSRIGEMPLEQIREVARNIRRIGGGIVLLTGGEPFLREDLPSIVEAFKRQGLDVRLQTAGTKMATEAKLQECYDAGARDINVSLDSLEFDKFDFINGVPGSAKNAVETIERISRVFRKRSAILSFGTVLSRYNYKEIPAIIEFARRIGWFVSLVPVHIAKPTTNKGFQSFDRSFLFGEMDTPSLEAEIENLIQLKAKGQPLFDSERFLRSAAAFLKGNPPLWRHQGVCDSPNLYFAIRPNGDFTTCCDYTLKNPPKVYSEEFVSKYRTRKLHKDPEVLGIVNNCDGCHYGSYPEVTLSVRDNKALLERIKLVWKSGQGRLARADVTSGFIDEVNRIKSIFPTVYPSTTWLTEEINQKLARWIEKESRALLLKEDFERRKVEGRVRGQPASTELQQRIEEKI